MDSLPHMPLMENYIGAKSCQIPGHVRTTINALHVVIRLRKTLAKGKRYIKTHSKYLYLAG